MRHSTRTIVSLFLIIGLMLFCRGLKMTVFAQETSMMSSQHALHTDIRHAPSDQMSCCGSSDDTTTNLMDHTIEALVPTSIDIGLFALFLTFAISTLLVLHTQYQTGTTYHNLIRDRYGSWRAFVYEILLFQTGILHPKTFA